MRLAGSIIAGARAARMQRCVETIVISFLGHFLPVPQLPEQTRGGQGKLVSQIHNVPESTEPCSDPHL